MAEAISAAAIEKNARRMKDQNHAKVHGAEDIVVVFSARP